MGPDSGQPRNTVPDPAESPTRDYDHCWRNRVGNQQVDYGVVGVLRFPDVQTVQGVA